MTLSEQQLAALDDINWNSDGLIAAIAQDHESKQVLMLAWMNKDALRLTLEEQRAVYWSRSRQEIWRKGETSGHVQHLKDIRLDCDKDAILMQVDQVGGKACHTGRAHCFFNQWQGKEWQVVEETKK